MEDIVCSFSAVEWMDASLMAMTSKMLEGMPGKRLKHIWDIFSDRGSIMPEPEEILGDGIEYIALD